MSFHVRNILGYFTFYLTQRFIKNEIANILMSDVLEYTCGESFIYKYGIAGSCPNL